jgi:O-antigen ligase
VARKANFLKKYRSDAIPFGAIVIFLVLAFLTGGGARGDIQSLIILRPVAIIFCGIGLWRLKWEHVRANRFLFGVAAAIFALVLSHAVPLPHSIWSSMPGRDIIRDVDKAAQLGDLWRPLSMVPSATWNAFFSLFVPMTVLVFGVQLCQEARFRLLPYVLGLGLFSGFWGIIQIAGPPDGALYLYSITTNGTAVGLFANRNHQAMMLATLFPMLAVFAAATAQSTGQSGLRLWLAIGSGVVLVPLLLVTGSRAGFILGLLGLLSAVILFRKPQSISAKFRKAQRWNLPYAIVAFGVLCLTAVTVLMSRAEAIQRLFAPGQGEEDRLQFWGPIARIAWKYFPFGSGVGSFVEVYQIDEPIILLTPEYLNHAHNDWLEVYLTCGLPGLLLLGVGLIAWTKVGLRSLRTPLGSLRDVAFARLGFVITLIFLLGSVADYPLRTPSLACVFVIALLWLTPNSDRRLPLSVNAEKRDGSYVSARLASGQRK